VRSNVHVSLSNGRFMRNTSPVGTARPGVEISIDYQIDDGEFAPIEHPVLVIRSAKSRGELENLHEMRFRRSGTIHASSFMARPEDGPYEAWVEVASMPGPLEGRKKVSSSVALQFTDVPVVDPFAGARAAEEAARQQMEAQQRQMMNPGAMPGTAPGASRPGPFGPMGPRGPRGRRFGPGPP
jgi:hypothetical protein